MVRGRPKKTMMLVREECPQAMIDVATRRTLPHVTCQQMVDFDLRQLAANCYMQGVIDTSVAMLNRGIIADAALDKWEPGEEPLEYQI
jgi:hypothetical protein